MPTPVDQRLNQAANQKAACFHGFTRQSNVMHTASAPPPPFLLPFLSSPRCRSVLLSFHKSSASVPARCGVDIGCEPCLLGAWPHVQSVEKIYGGVETRLEKFEREENQKKSAENSSWSEFLSETSGVGANLGGCGRRPLLPPFSLCPASSTLDLIRVTVPTF